MLKPRYCILSLAVAGLMLIPLAASFADDGAGRWYGGIGLGLSRLDPDLSGPIYQMDDDSDTGFKLTLGYDWSQRISIEGYYSDLGEAGLSPNGTVSYRDIGASGLYYVYQQVAGEHRGWEAFLKAGLGWMKNDSDLPYERLHNSHVMFGLGGGYGFDNGISLRADLDLYDKDSQLLVFSLVKRFGRQQMQPESVAAPPQPVVPVAQADTDLDGVADSADRCPATPQGTTVDARGCKLDLDPDGDGVPDPDDKCPDTAAGSKVDQLGCATRIVLQDVMFEHDKAELTAASRERLDQVVVSLSRRPDIDAIQVIGHTDGRGNKAYNQRLSEKRARRVLDYLVSKGMDAARLTAIGMGESEPIADNETEAGRRLNRRVELKLITE